MATSWRGEDGENKMTPADWRKRAAEQARAMHAGLDAFDSSPDDEGFPTGGCYNSDYPDSWHDECNRRLETDEYYEAQTEADLRKLGGLILETQSQTVPKKP